MLNHNKPLKGMDHQRIYLDIGMCLLAKGDHQGAMDNWHEVLNYNPDNAAAHLQLALLLDTERHLSAAVKEYKEYIRLAPDNAETAKIKNKVLLLEQKLRSVSPDSPLQSPGGYSTRTPSSTAIDLHDGTNENATASSGKNHAKKSEPKKDVLAPNGKESGF